MAGKTFDRVYQVIDKFGARELERKTGIKADRWNNIKRQSARCSLDELDALAEAYSEYDEWLRTGRTNPEAGQISPELEEISDSLKKTGTDTE